METQNKTLNQHHLNPQHHLNSQHPFHHKHQQKQRQQQTDHLNDTNQVTQDTSTLNDAQYRKEILKLDKIGLTNKIISDEALNRVNGEMFRWKVKLTSDLVKKYSADINDNQLYEDIRKYSNVERSEIKKIKFIAENEMQIVVKNKKSIRMLLDWNEQHQADNQIQIQEENILYHARLCRTFSKYNT